MTEEPQGPRSSDRLGVATGKALIWRGLQHAGTRGISFVRFLILAHILMPEDFGVLAVAAISVETIESVTEAGLSSALVLQKDPQRPQYDTAWTVKLARALAIVPIIFLASPLLADIFGEPRAAPLLNALALRPVLTALESIRIAELRRHLRFRSIAAVRLTAVVIESVAAVALAPTLGVWGLVIGTLIGTGVGSAISYVVAPYRPRLAFSWAAAAPMFRFGRWIFVAGVLAILGQLLLRGIVSRRLGAADLGIYYVAVRVAMLPNDVVSVIVSSVAFPLQAQLQGDPPRAARVFRMTLRAVLAVLVIVYALLAAVADSAVRNLLGGQWLAAVPVIRVLVLVGVLGSVFDATAALLKGWGRAERVAGLFALQGVVVTALAWELAGHLGVMGAAIAWLGAHTTVQVAGAVFAARLLPRPFAGVGSALAATILAGAAGGSVAMLLVRAFPGLLGLGAGGLLGLVVALLTLASLDQTFHLGLRADLLKVLPGLSRRVPAMGWVGRLTRRSDHGRS